MDSKLTTAKNKLVDFINKLILPRSNDQDISRKEFIFNILLVSVIALLVAAIVEHVISWNILHLISPQSFDNSSFSLNSLAIILVFFFALYLLSRRGFFRTASYALLGIMFVLAAYMGSRWGVDLPAEILFYSLIIVMAGILINARFAFLVTGLVFSIIALTGYMHNVSYLSVNRYWSNELWETTDIVIAGVLFLTIATVSWLSNREIEKSLTRARKSEEELKKERDSLEIKIEERTKELKEAELEKMSQLYRFAEFGRLSTGIFHDLVNPLNAVVLNMEMVTKCHGERQGFAETKVCLDRALNSTKKMEKFVMAVRKQVSNEKSVAVFSLNQELKEVIEILTYKAVKEIVKIFFYPSAEVKVTGDPIKFNQIALNLIANAIDSYGSPESREYADGTVEVRLWKDENNIVLSVKDFGEGIPKENMEKIFEPFFTTKKENGMGVGLSTVKRIVEKDFKGIVEVESEVGEGSVFTVKLPVEHDRF